MNRAARALRIDPDNLRPSLLTLVLRTAVVLGLVVYLPSVYFAFAKGLYGVVAIDTAVVAAIVAMAVLTRIPFRWRAAGLCFICYVLAVGLLISVGALSQIYLFLFSIMTVLLLGVRVGMGAVVLSSVTFFAIGSLGQAAQVSLPNWTYDLSTWVVVTLNFTVVDVLLTLTVGAVFAATTNALTRERASRLLLDGERQERERLLSQLQLQISRMPLGYLMTDRDFRYTRWNPAAERMFGFAEADVLGKHPFEFMVPAAAQPLVAGIFEQIKLGDMNAHGESVSLTKDGGTVACEWHNTPIHDEAGAFLGVLSLAQDVTERKKLADQLRQAHKMEAVGLLAGGVAHDFNNLLTVVLSCSEFVMDELPKSSPSYRDVEEIHRAGIRAADLTRRLLMFGRKQVLEPKVLDLNDVLSGVDQMLRRVVDEDVELMTIPGTALGRVLVDPGSIEQVIMNLVVNARDAMPTGGKVTMETANVTLDEAYAKTHLGAKPGPHVMLSVSDSGTGMDKATLARIFEPFFTTKENGKGTGLGLATVFGIVQQSNGTIWVYSEVGLGTTFKIYLPRVDAEAFVPITTPVQTRPRGEETILLVEDEDQVREVAHGILRRHGYQVLAARNAGEALLLCEQHPALIHLLVTDVVMPQMSGPSLAKRLALLRPDMKVLFISGYTDNAAIRHGVIDAKVAYLQKPLTAETLTRKVRGVLDAG